MSKKWGSTTWDGANGGWRRATKTNKSRASILAATPPPDVAVVVGVDPGLKGGLAALRYPERSVYQFMPMPVVAGVIDAIKVAEWLLFIWKNDGPIFVGVEQQQIRYGGGANANALSNIANYGRLLAAIETAYRLGSCGIPNDSSHNVSTAVDTFSSGYVAFHPNMWQRHLFGVNTYDKADGIGYCQAHDWPTPRNRGGNVKDGITDAFCIAEYTVDMVRLALMAERGM